MVSWSSRSTYGVPKKGPVESHTNLPLFATRSAGIVQPKRMHVFAATALVRSGQCFAGTIAIRSQCLCRKSPCKHANLADGNVRTNVHAVRALEFYLWPGGVL